MGRHESSPLRTAPLLLSYSVCTPRINMISPLSVGPKKDTPKSPIFQFRRKVQTCFKWKEASTSCSLQRLLKGKESDCKGNCRDLCGYRWMQQEQPMHAGNFSPNFRNFHQHWISRFHVHYVFACKHYQTRPFVDCLRTEPLRSTAGGSEIGAWRAGSAPQSVPGPLPSCTSTSKVWK